MTWIKLDTRFFDRPAIAELNDRAVIMLLHMMCLAKELETDGIITDAQMRRLPYPRAKYTASKLEASGELVRNNSEASWELVGWLNDNKSKAELDEIRKKRAISGRKGGTNRKQVAKQSASTMSNPESRVQSPESREPPPPTVTQDPHRAQLGSGGGETNPPTAKQTTEPHHQAVVAALTLAALDDTEPALGELRTAQRAMGRGWTADQIADLGAEARDKATRSPRGWIQSRLGDYANEDPPTPSARRKPRNAPLEDRLAAAGIDLTEGAA